MGKDIGSRFEEEQRWLDEEEREDDLERAYSTSRDSAKKKIEECISKGRKMLDGGNLPGCMGTLIRAEEGLARLVGFLPFGDRNPFDELKKILEYSNEIIGAKGEAIDAAISYLVDLARGYKSKGRGTQSDICGSRAVALYLIDGRSRVETAIPERLRNYVNEARDGGPVDDTLRNKIGAITDRLERIDGRIRSETRPYLSAGKVLDYKGALIYAALRGNPVGLLGEVRDAADLIRSVGRRVCDRGIRINEGRLLRRNVIGPSFKVAEVAAYATLERHF